MKLKLSTKLYFIGAIALVLIAIAGIVMSFISNDNKVVEILGYVFSGVGMLALIAGAITVLVMSSKNVSENNDNNNAYKLAVIKLYKREFGRDEAIKTFSFETDLLKKEQAKKIKRALKAKKDATQAQEALAALESVFN